MNNQSVVEHTDVSFERGVAYGAPFPDSIDTMHQAK